MRVFVYEYLTALGLGRDATDAQHPMYREGLAMRDASTTDLNRILGCQAFSLPESPVGEAAFRDAAASANWSLIIAPESEGILTRLAQEVVGAGGRFLGPSLAAIELTTDKLSLANHWRTQGVPTPATTNREPTPCEAFPAVWKPRDGAGSTATFLLTNSLDVAWARAQVAAGEYGGPMILQQFVPGRPASVAFLCGPAGRVPLLPTFQTLTTDGRFHYLGGELPIPAELAERAVRLGERALDGIPGLLGYVGVDLVLGEAADGSGDYAIEVNPRLTTSYIGLRAVAGCNLAEKLLEQASDRGSEPITWKSNRIRFTTDQQITPLS